MKAVTFLVPYASSSDTIYPASNLAALTTQPLGWASSRFCTYPQELLIQFQNQMIVKKIQVLSHEKKISHKIEVYVGRNQQQQKSQQRNQNYSDDGIKFQRIGYFTFSSNDQSNWQARELKIVQIEQQNCSYIRLVLQKYHDNRYNLFGQVGIVAIRVYGEAQQLAPPSSQRPRLSDYKSMMDQKEETQRDESLIDSQTMLQIYSIQYSQQQDYAAKSEDFEAAKKFKVRVDELKIIGKQIQELEDRKAQAIQNEDYDNAQLIKRQILDHRINAGQIDEYGNEFKPNINYIKQDIQPPSQRPQQYKQSQQDIIQEQSEIQYDPKDSPVDQSKQYDNILQEQSPYFAPEEVDPDFSQLEEKPSQKPKYINHDDVVIPAIANKLKLEEEENQQEKDAENEPPLEALEALTINNEKLAEPLIPYFTLEFCKKLFSKQWIMREESFHWLSQQLQIPTQIKQDPKEMLFQLGLQVVQMGLNDKIERVITASLTCFQSLLQHVDLKQEQSLKGEIPIYLDNILLVLMEKIGDNNARVKDEAEKIIQVMAESSSVGILPIINQLMRGITTKPKLQASARHTHARLIIAYNLIKKQKIKSKIPFQLVIDFAVKHLDNPAENVRSAAIYIIGEVYRENKDLVRASLGSVRPAIMQVLEEVFIRINNGQEIEGTIEIDKNKKIAIDSTLKVQKPNLLQKEQQKAKNPDGKVQISCEFCGLSDSELGKNNKLDLHLWRECPMLTTCLSCGQVVEIQTLSAHQIDECDQKIKFAKCKRCEVAVLITGMDNHMHEQGCTSSKDHTCPLCFESLKDWRLHLPICTKNERNKRK